MSEVPNQPLDRSRREIRLVVLKDNDDTFNRSKASNTPNPPLRCELIVTSLDLYKEPLRNYPVHEIDKVRNALARKLLENQPISREFYALSYVWGDPASVCDLEINGKATKIGVNLHAALHSIRKKTNFRTIWADALRINQSDNEEKSWQVQQMAAIYSRARATISWLGLSSEDSKLALDTLVELGKKTSRFFGQYRRLWKEDLHRG
jgi:Heterokaryon incompatibility protein (HET)